MNHHKGFIVPLLLIIIAVLVLGGGVYVYTQKKQENPPVTGSVVLPQTTSTIPTTNQTTSPTQNSVGQLSTFSSSRFGLTFEYNSKMVIENDGDIVYIDFLQNHQTHEGDSLQVFKKSFTDSLSDAIKKVIYSNNLSASCSISSISTNTHKNFIVKGGSIVTASISGNPGCKYADAGSPGFFFEDTTRPALFYFIRTGTAFGALGTIRWQETLKTTPTI